MVDAPLTQQAMRLALALLTCSLLALACAGEPARDDADDGVRSPDTSRPFDAGEDAPTELADAGGGDAPPSDPPAEGWAALRIDPAVVELATGLGVPAQAPVAAVGIDHEGVEHNVTSAVTWRSEAWGAIRIDEVGVLTASGEAAGEFLYSAELGGLRADATVRVRISQLVIDPDVTPAELDALDDGLPDPAWAAPSWLYPEHQTVYPAGLTPPVLQWSHDLDDVFHLAIEVGALVRLDVFTHARQWTFDRAQWALVSEHFGTPITMTLTSAGGVPGRVGRAEPRELLTADASLEGSVYYWQIRTGDIMEIPYDAPAARPLFPDNAETGNCRGCHAITRDGGRIAFMYNGGDNPRAGLAWVGAPDPPIVANSSRFQWDFVSFEPAGLRAAAVHHGRMWLADTTPGLPEGLAELGPVPGVNEGGRAATHPAWSPDGTLLAFVDRDPGGVDWSFGWGDLWVLPWDAGTEAFGAPRRLVERGAGDQDTISYPTWSPDSRWLAYSRGPDNRGEPPANLFVADPLTGDATQLLRGGPAGQDVLPAFSPFREGGYYWLLFYSRRPYGAVTTNKQLWVMAIDANHVPGTDPSHPAFWLPGQNPAESNITAYWARVGCAREGNECKSDDDCCVGLSCLPDGEGATTCQRVDCVLPGRPCTSADTCCPGFECGSSLVGTAVCIEVFE